VSVLTMEGYDVTACQRGDDARQQLRRRAFDIVLVDLYMTPVDGMTLLRATLEVRPRTLVIVMTGNPSVDSSIEGLRAGAWDYLPKPFSAASLQVLAGRAAHTVLVGRETTPREKNESPVPSSGAESLEILGTTPSFRRVIELAKRVAPTDA